MVDLPQEVTDPLESDERREVQERTIAQILWEHEKPRLPVSSIRSELQQQGIDVRNPTIRARLTDMEEKGVVHKTEYTSGDHDSIHLYGLEAQQNDDGVVDLRYTSTREIVLLRNLGALENVLIGVMGAAVSLLALGVIEISVLGGQTGSLVENSSPIVEAESQFLEAGILLLLVVLGLTLLLWGVEKYRTRVKPAVGGDG